jgi:RNA polymerase sigma factor (sigma-70 family)
MHLYHDSPDCAKGTPSIRFMTEKEFVQLLHGCQRRQRASQYQLHGLLYNYAMSVARRYAGGLEAAEEVTNDAFFKVFTKIDQFVWKDGEAQGAFRGWFRRIVINTAIDRCRSSLHTTPSEELTYLNEASVEDGLLEQLTFEQVMRLLDYLPPAYRTVFGLFVADGFTHEEIAEMLQINIGTSKSNLSRARQYLKKLLSNEIAFNPYL